MIWTPRWPADRAGRAAAHHRAGARIGLALAHAWPTRMGTSSAPCNRRPPYRPGQPRDGAADRKGSHRGQHQPAGRQRRSKTPTGSTRSKGSSPSGPAASWQRGHQPLGGHRAGADRGRPAPATGGDGRWPAPGTCCCRRWSPAPGSGCAPVAPAGSRCPAGPCAPRVTWTSAGPWGGQGRAGRVQRHPAGVRAGHRGQQEQLATLLRLTERYCVVYQTLAHPVPVSAPSPLARRLAAGVDFGGAAVSAAQRSLDVALVVQ